MNHCVRHFEETMEATCRTCQAPFCSRCLVYAFGPKKPPFCIGCALNAGGVRNGYRVAPAASAKPSRREAKAAARAAARQEKAAGRRWRGGEPAVPLPPAAASPIQFDAGWIETVEHGIRMPAAQQLPSLMRSGAEREVGQHV
ncbi:MAG: hypothetical protein KDB02_13455 [Acidimicrobiales bacterium]|nr:hypothetical protein [Acidimicrobiales bacterium]